MKLKHILIASGLFIGAAAAFGYQKVKNLQAIFDKMSIKPVDISGLNVGAVRIKFKLDIKIVNPTNEYFSVSGASVARLKTLSIFRNGDYLGTANLDLEEIDIPANSYKLLKYVPFEVDTLNLVTNIFSMASVDISQLTIVATVDVLGTEYIIEG